MLITNRQVGFVTDLYPCFLPLRAKRSWTPVNPEAQISVSAALHGQKPFPEMQRVSLGRPKASQGFALGSRTVRGASQLEKGAGGCAAARHLAPVPHCLGVTQGSGKRFPPLESVRGDLTT